MPSLAPRVSEKRGGSSSESSRCEQRPPPSFACFMPPKGYFNSTSIGESGPGLRRLTSPCLCSCLRLWTLVKAGEWAPVRVAAGRSFSPKFSVVSLHSALLALLIGWTRFAPLASPAALKPSSSEPVFTVVSTKYPPSARKVLARCAKRRIATYEVHSACSGSVKPSSAAHRARARIRFPPSSNSSFSSTTPSPPISNATCWQTCWRSKGWTGGDRRYLSSPSPRFRTPPSFLPGFLKYRNAPDPLVIGSSKRYTVAASFACGLLTCADSCSSTSSCSRAPPRTFANFTRVRITRSSSLAKPSCSMMCRSRALSGFEVFEITSLRCGIIP
mmetsp:Transcript_7626/g.18610  ORF Transcript_7626/g.18610 Transcript_7626/m.18610 type:complete len:330 (-) Transcript_7626:661-1650(-)